MTKLQKLMTLVSAVVLVTVLGCSAWMEGITPAHVDPAAIEYANVSPTIYTPYISLWDARRIQRKMNFEHLSEQTKISRELEDDQMRHRFLDDAMQMNIQSAEELRDTLFSSTGPISLLFAAVPGLALGGYLIQRPTDKKRIAELENGKTV